MGGELTSGRPDLKEGLYFGEELGADDPRVAAGWPLHGANLFPEEVPELKGAVLAFMRWISGTGHGHGLGDPWGCPTSGGRGSPLRTTARSHTELSGDGVPSLGEAFDFFAALHHTPAMNSP